MELFWHILERGGLHVVASMFIYTVAYIGFNVWMRKGFKYGDLIVPVFFVLPFVWMREAFDVSHGQPVVKVITDYFSWVAGLALAAWAVKRLQWLGRKKKS